MMKKKYFLLSACLVLVMILSACSTDNGQSDHQQMEMNHSNMNMDHSGSGQIPPGMKSVSNPIFKIGSIVILKDGHMPGMQGASATVVGAYSTSVYSVSYVPATGGEKVTDHKWVVQEEIKNAGSAPFSIGDQVTLTADHMKGMNGAKATIDSVQNTTVYIVDFVPTTGGEIIKNHMWVTEDEVAAK